MEFAKLIIEPFSKYGKHKSRKNLMYIPSFFLVACLWRHLGNVGLWSSKSIENKNGPDEPVLTFTYR